MKTLNYIISIIPFLMSVGCSPLIFKNDTAKEYIAPSLYYSGNNEFVFQKGLSLGALAIDIDFIYLRYHCHTHKLTIRAHIKTDLKKLIIFVGNDSNGKLTANEDTKIEIKAPQYKTFSFSHKLAEHENIYLFSPHFKMYRINIDKLMLRCG